MDSCPFYNKYPFPNAARTPWSTQNQDSSTADSQCSPTEYRQLPTDTCYTCLKEAEDEWEIWCRFPSYCKAPEEVRRSLIYFNFSNVVSTLKIYQGGWRLERNFPLNSIEGMWCSDIPSSKHFIHCYTHRHSECFYSRIFAMVNTLQSVLFQ